MRGFKPFGLLALCSVFALSACANNKAAIDRVGVNAVKKSFFENSSWYFARTVIDVDYEGGALGSFPGDAAIDFQGSDLTSMPRIRWVIDEKALYAYRDYELLEGGNPGSPEPGSILSHPVAAFEIEKHFDIRRAYNEASGEEQNVIEENDTDRPWYEREYMRVNWGKNLLPGYYGQTSDLYAIIGLYERQEVDLFVQAESEFPDSWMPRFHFMECAELDDPECSEDERPYANDFEKDDLYAFDFVTQEVLAPGEVDDPFTGQMVNFCVSPYVDAPACSSISTFVRNSFLRVSETKQYEPVNWIDTRFERAGYFRLERPTLDRSTSPDDPAFGRTDFLNYNINRHNLWYNWYEEITTEDGDVLERRPVPYSERRVRPIIYYTSSEMPAHLIEPSFQVAERWNEVFMNMVRHLKAEPLASYPDVACQDGQPDGYCACIRDPESGAVLNPTCPGQYDPFETPDQARARGVENPYDCWVDVPADARPDVNRFDLTDADYNGWFQAKQSGGECVVTARVNTCNLATIEQNGGNVDGMACQERGDSRFKFLSYVDQPGTPFLGIATLRGDPVTGELIVGDANTGGPALDGYRTTALQMYDLVNGDLTDEEFLIGEDVRAYLENLNRVQLPARPQVDFNVALKNGTANPVERQAIDNKMASFAIRAQELAGPAGRANTFIDRAAKLKGTDIERRLLENEETLMLAGIDRIPDHYGPADISEDMLNRVSPFRAPVHEQLRKFIEQENAISRANVLMPNEFVDNSVLSFVTLHKDWSRARLEITLNQLLYFQTQLHELGHCLGLRHNFGGSVDSGNYDDEYYQIAEQVPLPDPSDFDEDATPGLSADEQVEFETALESARERRELAGIDRYMNSSIMEYTSQWYERVHTQAGRHDIAAISFGYGDLVEIYDNQADRTLASIDPSNTKRIWAAYYHGGELCETDAQCPFSESGAQAASLTSANMASGLTQSCVPHPHGEATHGRICTNFDDDAAGLIVGDSSPRYAPVSYRFCSDDRVGTLGWCHRFDEGDSYREIIRNVAEQYERQYIFTNFRRYKSGFSIGGYLFDRLIDRQFTILQDVFQSLLFRYQVDANFRDETGAFGFYDQFLATADVLNLYARILGQPDVGSYVVNPVSGNFEKASAFPGAFGSQLDVGIGLGRYLFSTYQRGLTGITRLERIGSFYDKWIVMQMLTERGWTSSYTRDVPFWTNYYDLFPTEMQQIFKGLIQDLPESISPRLLCEGGMPGGTCSEPRLIYMDFYRGDCSDPSTCRPDPITETYAGLDVVDGGNSILLQYLAAVFSLSYFPVFFDTTFHNQLFICVEGQGDCFQPNPDAVEGEDYVAYESERFGKTFLAWHVEQTADVVGGESIGFNMVKEASNNAFVIEVLEDVLGGGSPTSDDMLRLDEIGYALPVAVNQQQSDLVTFDRRQQSLESFFFQLIELERELGVASYLSF